MEADGFKFHHQKRGLTMNESQCGEREKKSSPLLAEFHSIVWFQIFPEHISTWDKDKQGSQIFFLHVCCC